MTSPSPAAPSRPAHEQRRALAAADVALADSALYWHLKAHKTCGRFDPCKAYEEYETDLATAEKALEELTR